MLKIVKKIIDELKNIKIVNKFSDNLKFLFKGSNYINSSSKILVELNQLRDCHIIYGYFANSLSKKNNAIIEAFLPKFFSSNINWFFFHLKKICKLDYFRVYSSFNTRNFFYPKKKFYDESKKKANKLLSNLVNKKDILNIKINDIEFGDLIYDAYLRNFNKATIDLKDKNFEKHLINFYLLYLFWKNYFSKNTVKGVILSDCVYEFGIIARISYKLNIPVYHASTLRIVHLNKNNPNLFDAKYYRQEFQNYSEKEKRKKIQLGKDFLEKRFFEKEINFENKFSNLPKTSFFEIPEKRERFLKNNGKPNCIIACHHFSDAPHAYGKFLFDDFYEWTDYLGKLSQKIDYNWYLRLHPYEESKNEKFVRYFKNKYPNLIPIPSRISHNHFINYEKVDLVLTVYGTIGLEYAYHGIPVINATKNNPHISYDFNFHPKDREELEGAIKNFKKLQLDFSKKNLYEYYYMRYLDRFYFYEDELYNFTDSKDSSIKSYNRWLNYFNISRHNQLIKVINQFININKFILK